MVSVVEQLRPYTKILVLGTGNPILTDDGIGPLVVNRVRKKFNGPGVDFVSTNLSGVHLLDIIAGYDSLIVIDAIQRGDKPGKISWYKPGDFASISSGSNSQHRVGILQALKLGEDMGQAVPKEVSIMAIEVTDLITFGEDMTPEVKEAVPIAVEQVIDFLEKRQTGTGVSADADRLAMPGAK